MSIINLIKFLNIIFGAPFWKGVAAVATTGVVILTFLSLRRMRQERKAQINREGIEKIYNIVFQDLKTILNLHKIELLESIYPANWKWEEVKNKEPYIAYQTPEELFKKLNKFSKEVEDYELLKDSLKEQFENLLTKIVESKEILDRNKFKKIEDIRYFEGTGLSYKNISIFQLFFHSKNLKEFLGKSDLKGKFVIYFFNSEGRKSKEINEEKFDKILNVINNRDYLFSRYLSQEKFQKLFDFYQKINSLKDEIEEMILQLARTKI